ncbi:uncharacterized protein BBOV_IV011450 [Babesia bovis T2Bo]|uniref:Uncharacterized protein n=1 Tax=Babesia bovis TaxID=5865 RepID=A7ASH8_BABBO|nr:uncharacterized protein BBOV_IV011450 [Babesia bovis T2Bo]EDO07497.1 hypothetical protein BBOV_IV011450 [Babesia bovis T2Bo]|eukprot:XP_001611065.1 hypothetical protein [Babesia bovis T2Bo]
MDHSLTRLRHVGAVISRNRLVSRHTSGLNHYILFHGIIHRDPASIRPIERGFASSHATDCSLKVALDNIQKNYESYLGTPLPVQKKQLKQSWKSLLPYLDQCDESEMVKVLRGLITVSKRIRSPLVHQSVVLKLIKNLSTDRDVTQVVNPGSEVDHCVSDEAKVALVLSSFRLCDVKHSTRDIIDDLVSLASSTLYRWDFVTLVDVCRDLSWIYRFYHHEPCATLLRKALNLACDSATKPGNVVSRKQLITLMKAMSAIGNDSVTITNKVNHLVATLLSKDDTDIPTDITQRLELQYRRSKGNVHLLYVALVSGFPVKTGLIQSLLNSVMQFCYDYFTTTCKFWKSTVSYMPQHDYNNIDPRVHNLLYAKCPNKVIRLPGSLEKEKPQQTKLEERYQVVIAALNRLEHNNKHAFCRGIKLCSAHLRMMNGELDDRTRAFLAAVNAYKPEGLILQQYPELFAALRQLGYKPVPILIDGLFQVNCIDHEGRMYCQMYNHKQARYTKRGITYNAQVALELSYLEAAGWRGAVILYTEWQRLDDQSRLKLLKERLNI